MNRLTQEGTCRSVELPRLSLVDIVEMISVYFEKVSWLIGQCDLLSMSLNDTSYQLSFTTNPLTAAIISILYSGGLRDGFGNNRYKCFL